MKYLLFIFQHTIYSSFGVDITFQNSISWDTHTMKTLSDTVILGDNHFKITYFLKKEMKWSKNAMYCNKGKKQVLSYQQLLSTIFQRIFGYFSIKNNWN